MYFAHTIQRLSMDLDLFTDAVVELVVADSSPVFTLLIWYLKQFDRPISSQFLVDAMTLWSLGENFFLLFRDKRVLTETVCMWGGMLYVRSISSQGFPSRMGNDPPASISMLSGIPLFWASMFWKFFVVVWSKAELNCLNFKLFLMPLPKDSSEFS